MFILKMPENTLQLTLPPTLKRELSSTRVFRQLTAMVRNAEALSLISGTSNITVRIAASSGVCCVQCATGSMNTRIALRKKDRSVSVTTAIVIFRRQSLPSKKLLRQMITIHSIEF